MYDLVALGELLVDFTPMENSANGNPCFERNPGGGPANLSCTVAKLGGKVTFMSQVGDDMFGRALKDIVEKEHVDCSNLRLSKEYKTTLAFVALDENGERSFSFYRKNGADTMMETKDYDLTVIDKAKYFFLSSVLMAEGISRKTSFEMLEYAKEKGVPIIFDPNLRFNLWEDHKDLKECVLKTLNYANVVKVSEEELSFLMDIKESKESSIDQVKIHKAALQMKKDYNIDVLLITLGKDGCVAFTDKGEITKKGFAVEKPVDTTAAGDSFTGGFIYELIQCNKLLSECSLEELERCIYVGNAVGSLTVRKRGAISALPTKEELETFLEGESHGNII